MAYGIHDLELTGLQVKTILSVHIFHRPGEHGVLELAADLGESELDIPVQEMGAYQPVTLTGNKEGSREILFSGVITKLTAEAMGKSCHVAMTAKTYSYLMDIEKKSRSFQDISLFLGALTGKIVGEYPGAACQLLFADAAMGEMAVQYQETDWAFLKRMLSARHIPLACSEVRESLCIYAGTARIPAQVQTIEMQRACKAMDVFSYWRQAGENVTDTEFLIYRLKLDNRVPLYSEITFRGKEFLVSELEYVTEGSVVYECISLQNKGGILEKTIYPMQLVGSALEGNVLDVKGENVQIHLKIDNQYPGNDCYWFPFSTPSASPDGSGWYCMPEKGDQVRVYFPSKRTGEVIAISAVSSYMAPAAATVSADAAGDTGRPEDGNSEESSTSSGNRAGGGSSTGSKNSIGSGSSAGTGAGSPAQAYAPAAGTAAAAASGPAAGAGAGSAAGGKDRMGDPAAKYLRTVDGQEIQLAPGGITVTCSGGAVKVEILKSGQISLYAQSYIEFAIQKNITMSAKAGIVLRSPKTELLKSDMGGNMYLDKKGNIYLSGTQVLMN